MTRSMSRSSLQAEIKKRASFQTPHEEAVVNLLRTHSALFAEHAALFKRFGLSEPQYNVLRILRGARSEPGHGVPCAEIAERMITRVPDITRLVERLVRSRLARRRRSRTDRRVVLVSITARGRALLARIDRPLEELQRALLGHLSRGELSQLTRLLIEARRAPRTEC